MNSRLTAREYAYVAISGPGGHQKVTDILGLKPTEGCDAGETRWGTGRPAKGMVWQLQSGLDDTRPLREHIECLLTYFAHKSAAARELWVDYDLTLQCVGYYPNNRGPGVHFDREVIRQAAQLGLAIDCDFYFQEDSHDAQA